MHNACADLGDRPIRALCVGVAGAGRDDERDTLQAALDAGAEIIMLDNMSTAKLRQAVALIDGRAVSEASGGVTLHTVREIAETGVDWISVGALTHSAKALDLALDFE